MIKNVVIFIINLFKKIFPSLLLAGILIFISWAIIKIFRISKYTENIIIGIITGLIASIIFSCKDIISKNKTTKDTIEKLINLIYNQIQSPTSLTTVFNYETYIDLCTLTADLICKKKYNEILTKYYDILEMLNTNSNSTILQNEITTFITILETFF